MNKPYIINLALTMSVISIVLFLLMAILGGGMFLSMGIGLAAIVLLIVVPIIFLRKQRAAANGFLSFKDAFITVFVGLTIAGIINVAFTMLYVNVIDTTYVDNMINQQLETTMKFMEGNVPEDKMVETLTEIETKTRYGFTTLGILRNLGIYIAVYALLALILAAIFKKQPEIVNTSEDIIDN